MSQSTYNQCSQALEICPNVPVQINNLGANVTLCTPCDDNFSFCFTPNNTIWLTFRTNSTGGFTQLSFSNLVFEMSSGQDTEAQATIIRAGSPCDGTSYTAQGNCVMDATGNFSLSANLLPSTLYYVVLNGAKNGAGITKAAEFTLDVLLNGPGVDRITPVLTIDSAPLYCKNELSTFIAHLSDCPDSSTYRWFINGVFVAETQDSIFETSILSNSDIVTVTNSCFIQCPVTPTASTPPLNVIEFLVDAGIDQQIKPGEAVVLDGTTDALNYYWTPDVAISNTTVLNPVVSPQITTSYFLTGVMNGCSITDEVVITVDLKLEISNTFSPNNDGKNDRWEIPGLVNYPNCLVQIYDRWGQLVYLTTGYNDLKAWDGKKNGKDLNEGTYFYSIDLRDNTSDILTGYVNLIR